MGLGSRVWKRDCERPTVRQWRLLRSIGWKGDRRVCVWKREKQLERDRDSPGLLDKPPGEFHDLVTEYYDSTSVVLKKKQEASMLRMQTPVHFAGRMHYIQDDALETAVFEIGVSMM